MLSFCQKTQIHFCENSSAAPKFFGKAKRELTNGAKVRILMPSSSGNCYEQDTTSPQHRLQKAVGCARRQQGAGQVIPCEQLWRKPGLSRPVAGAGFPPLYGSAVSAANERQTFGLQAKWYRGSMNSRAVFAFVFAWTCLSACSGRGGGFFRGKIRVRKVTS